MSDNTRTAFIPRVLNKLNLCENLYLYTSYALDAPSCATFVPVVALGAFLVYWPTCAEAGTVISFLADPREAARF